MATAVESPTWTGGQWIAIFEREGRKPRLRMIPEAGWPSPDFAESDRYVLHLDGSAYVEEQGLSRRLGAAQLLNAYTVQGETVLRRLRGSFAVLVFDSVDATLLGWRDPLGTHPLLYASSGRDIAVSPSLNALIRVPGVSRAVNPFFLAVRLIQHSGPPEETFFSGVRRLLAGHALSVDAQTLRIHRFWDPAEATTASDETPGETIRHFREILGGAVERCVEGRPAAIYLSGGLDSALVAAFAVDESRRSGLPAPLALSFGSPDPASNEEMGQQLVADRLGLSRMTMGVENMPGQEPSTLVSALELSRTTPGLMSGPTQSVYDALARRAIESGYGVILTGEGGDEWLLPRPEYLADRMRVLDVRAFCLLARAWYGFYPVFSSFDFALGILWLRGARPLARSSSGFALRHWSPRRLTKIRKRRFLEELPAWLMPDAGMREHLAEWFVGLRPEPRAADLYEHARRELLVHPNVAEYCEGAYAARRRVGIPTRSPLLDAAVVEFLFNVRPSRLVHGGQAKWLARRLLAPKLGDLVDRWPRTIYGDSFWEWVMHREGGQAWDTLGGATLLTELGIVDGRMLNRIFRDDVVSGRPVTDLVKLWHVMTLESWLRPRIL